jgi:inner membrane protein involved in colicin E2 resistance
VGQRGSLLPLIGGAAMLLLAVIFGAASATSLLIERQRLYSLADGAAVYASESFDPRNVCMSANGVVAPLTSQQVRKATLFYLSRVESDNLDGLSLDNASTPDGRHAEVSLSSLWKSPLTSDFFPVSLRISASAKAQAFVR